MTSFFVLGGSSTFVVLEDGLVADDVDVAEVELEGCTFAGLEVEGAGLSSWFLSFSRRYFKYNVLFIPDSDL